MTSATAHVAKAAPSTSHDRPARHPVIAITAITNASRNRSPSGYARFVATVESEPSVLATTPKTSAAPTAAIVSPHTSPSSHSTDDTRPARARRSRTSAT